VAAADAGVSEQVKQAARAYLVEVIGRSRQKQAAAAAVR